MEVLTNYYIQIYPNGRVEKHLGTIWILFVVNGSKERKITANFTIAVESAENYKNIFYVYDDEVGYGVEYCKSDEFFESKNRFFVNGEITFKINGILKAERSLVTKISSPISLQWKITEEDLNAKKEIKDGKLYTKRTNIESISEIKFFLTICPNGIDDKKQRSKTWIYLTIEMEKEKRIEAVFDFSLDSGNYNEGAQYVF
uniref:Uncharacterized protein n=1 Tax=Panagrolaimus sp. ES5 TaxID=591445 RepID=A0AC34G087_9BILA